MAADAILNFRNFKLLTVGKVKKGASIYLDRPFCERDVVLHFSSFLSVNSLSPTSVNRHSWNFSTWRGYSPKGSAAMPISWKCPLTKIRGENPNFAQFRI